jgi:hypothetical protein
MLVEPAKDGWRNTDEILGHRYTHRLTQAVRQQSPSCWIFNACIMLQMEIINM